MGGATHHNIVDLYYDLPITWFRLQVLPLCHVGLVVSHRRLLLRSQSSSCSHVYIQPCLWHNFYVFIVRHNWLVVDLSSSRLDRIGMDRDENKTIWGCEQTWGVQGNVSGRREYVMLVGHRILTAGVCVYIQWRKNGSLLKGQGYDQIHATTMTRVTTCPIYYSIQFTLYPFRVSQYSLTFYCYSGKIHAGSCSIYIGVTRTRF